MVTITLELDDATAQRAEAAGLLTTEIVGALLEKELIQRRESAWTYLNDAMEAVRTAAAHRYAHLSEEEVMNLIDEEIDAIRTEKRTEAASARQDHA